MADSEEGFVLVVIIIALPAKITSLFRLFVDAANPCQRAEVFKRVMPDNLRFGIIIDNPE